jgi:hypothetical protein
VYKGTTAKLLHELMPGRTLWLFDTFEGFDDRDLAHERKGANGFRFDDTRSTPCCATSGRPSACARARGASRRPASAVPDDERFALVPPRRRPLQADGGRVCRSSIRACSPGGFIVLHDYGSGAWPGIAQAADDFFADNPRGLVRIPDKSGTRDRASPQATRLTGADHGHPRPFLRRPVAAAIAASLDRRLRARRAGRCRIARRRVRSAAFRRGIRVHAGDRRARRPS